MSVIAFLNIGLCIKLKSLDHSASGGCDGRNGNAVAKLLERLGVTHYDLERFGETLQAGPLPRRHAPNAYSVYFSLYFGNWVKIGQPVIVDQVSLTAHTSHYNGIGHTIIWNDFLTETISLGLVPTPMFAQRFKVFGREVVLHRNGSFFLNFFKSAGVFIAFWVFKLGRISFVTRANNKNSFAVLWHPEMACIEHLRIGNGVA
jgi:hypothetical protein